MRCANLQSSSVLFTSLDLHDAVVAQPGPIRRRQFASGFVTLY